MASKSCSSGFNLTHVFSAWPLLRFFGYCAQNSSKNCSCLLLLKGDRGLLSDGLSSGVAVTFSASTLPPDWGGSCSCAPSGACILLNPDPVPDPVPDPGLA